MKTNEQSSHFFNLSSMSWGVTIKWIEGHEGETVPEGFKDTINVLIEEEINKYSTTN